jgi:hypothetical protein
MMGIGGHHWADRPLRPENGASVDLHFSEYEYMNCLTGEPKQWSRGLDRSTAQLALAVDR